MNIPLADLREVSDLLFSHLEQSGCDTVELSDDFYWSVPQAQRYAPYEEPKELDMGQLSDDWRELMALIKGEKEPLAYGLVWLASIPRAVGEQRIR
jgi:hypothetical protein